MRNKLDACTDTRHLTHAAKSKVALAVLTLFFLPQGFIVTQAMENEEATVDVSILDDAGNPSVSAAMRIRLLILSTITNSGPVEKGFFYIVQIKDPEDRVIFLSVKPTVLDGTETKTVETLWLPDELGKHTIQVFLWQQIESPLTFFLLFNAVSDQ